MVHGGGWRAQVATCMHGVVQGAIHGGDVAVNTVMHNALNIIMSIYIYMVTHMYTGA